MIMNTRRSRTLFRNSALRILIEKRYIEHEDGKTQDVYVVRDGQKLTFEEAAADAGQGES